MISNEHARNFSVFSFPPYQPKLAEETQKWLRLCSAHRSRTQQWAEARKCNEKLKFRKNWQRCSIALDCLCVKISTEKLRISIPFKRSGPLERKTILVESHSGTIELIFSTLLASSSIYMFSMNWKCCDPLEKYHESIDDKVAIDSIINQETRHSRVGTKLSESEHVLMCTKIVDVKQKFMGKFAALCFPSIDRALEKKTTVFTWIMLGHLALSHVGNSKQLRVKK